MSLLQGFETTRLVKVGLSWCEQLERRIAGYHHSAVIARLRHFREGLEHDMDAEPWTVLEAPIVLILSDVIMALGCTEEERAQVLGLQGQGALAEILETRVRPRFDPRAVVNTRQAKGLAYLRTHERLDMSVYRELCPGFSDEALRLDLASLVRRGILTRNGTNRGTYYTVE